MAQACSRKLRHDSKIFIASGSHKASWTVRWFSQRTKKTTSIYRWLYPWNHHVSLCRRFPHIFLQCEAPKIAKLVYNSNNYGLWYLQILLTNLQLGRLTLYDLSNVYRWFPSIWWHRAAGQRWCNSPMQSTTSWQPMVFGAFVMIHRVSKIMWVSNMLKQ